MMDGELNLLSLLLGVATECACKPGKKCVTCNAQQNLEYWKTWEDENDNRN